MFCDEKIVNAYLGRPRHDRDGDLFFDYYHDMALHLTADFRIVLETENYYLSIETIGIFITEKNGPVQTLARDGEWLDSYYHYDEKDPDDSPWVDYEYTLFVGEKILSVTNTGKSYAIKFTDFTLRVISYSNGDDVPKFFPPPYSRLLGTERLIKRCSCGGTGILDLDIVGDYGVRCDTCHKGTNASMCACDAIEEWNSAEQLPMIGEYPSEKFARYCDKHHKPVDRIVMEGTRAKEVHFPFICKSIIVEMEDKMFCIQSCYTGQGNSGFSVGGLRGYNRERWAHIIKGQRKKIRLTSKFKDGNVRELCFDVDGKVLRVTSRQGYLIIDGPDDVKVQAWNGKAYC